MILRCFGKISFFNLGGGGEKFWTSDLGGRTILESRFILYFNYSVGIMVL